MSKIEEKKRANAALELAHVKPFAGVVGKLRLRAMASGLEMGLKGGDKVVRELEEAMNRAGMSQQFLRELEARTGSGAQERAEGGEMWNALRAQQVALDGRLSGLSDHDLLSHVRVHELATPEQITRAEAMVSDVEYVDLRGTSADPAVREMIPASLVRHHQMVPWRIDTNIETGEETLLTVHAGDAEAQLAKTRILEVTGYGVEPGKHWRYALAPKATIEAYIDRDYPDAEEARKLKNVASSAQSADTRLDTTNVVGNRLDRILRQGISEGASDIHLEMIEGGMVVRYRIDGELVAMPSMQQAGIMHNMVAVIKQVSRMDESERRQDQDGTMRVDATNLRVNVLPTSQGRENVVMRILRDAAQIPPVEDLEMSPRNLELLQGVMARQTGMLIVTGPTGSGKSTTNYAVLKELTDPKRKTVTIEQPIEYELSGPGAPTQVEVTAEMSFARALRATLRQDPDTIMVGEIRDFETASIALEAANTGHFMLSTLHTVNAPSAVQRLRHLGLAAYSIEAGLSGVVAQRLARRICENCKRLGHVEVHDIEPGVARRLGLADGARHTVGTGCPRCGNTGIKGRMGVHEMLVLDHRLKAAVIADVSALELMEMARAGGMRTLAEDAGEKVAAGHLPLSAAMALLSEQEAVQKGILEAEQ